MKRDLFKLKEAVGLLLLGLLAACCMETPVNAVIDRFVRPAAGSVRVVWMAELLLYAVIFVFFVLLLGVLESAVKKNTFRFPQFLLRSPTAADFFALWFLLFLLAVFIYKVIGIPNYLQIGDELGYWNTLLLNDGKWDLQYLAGLFAPRGYWCYVFQTIAQYAGKWTGIDASIIWMVFPSGAISWLTALLMPELYQCVTDRPAKRLHVTPVALILLTTWNSYLTGVIMDMFGVVTLVAAITYTMKFFKAGKYRYAIAAGLAGGVSCSLRTSNLYGLVAVAIYCLVVNRKAVSPRRLKRLAGLGLAVVMFLLISFPQFLINNERGHFGFLPYDHDQAWFGRSVTLWSSDVALTNGNVSYPVLATDDQMLTMKSRVYDDSIPLDADQLLDVYVHSPVETLMLIAKKLIIGFDVKTCIAYPENGVPWRYTAGMLFSVWNYFVLYCALFAIFRLKRLNGPERALGVLIFLTLVLPQTFMKIEWRYVIAGYIYLYYVFSFHFCELMLTGTADEKKAVFEDSGFLTGLAVFIFVFLTFSFIFLA